MKIKNIAAICKKNKQVVLFNRYGRGEAVTQYMGDGYAIYPISGLPELDEESILTIFDVPEKQREDWLVRQMGVPEGVNFGDTDTNEKIIEQGNLSIVYAGKTLKPLQTRRGLVFIESRYLSPISDVLDAAATDKTAKCAQYFTPETDGLKSSWKVAEGTVFCNPPYGREIGKWVQKAYEEAQAGTRIVLLIPARTDTSYFHDFIYGKAEIRFVRGRLRFTDDDGNAADPAPFPSMLVIYN